MLKKLLANAQNPQGVIGKIMIKNMNKGHKKLAFWGFEILSPQNAERCLDIGCGGGANIAELLRLCPKSFVCGIDYSQESVDASKEVNKEHIGKRCEILKGDAGSLPYENDSFDIITAFETVYFWPDLKKAFGEAKRVLKSGGRFMIVCEVSDPNSPWTKMFEGMKVYTAKELTEFLNSAGFEKVEVHSKKGWLCVIATKE